MIFLEFISGRVYAIVDFLPIQDFKETPSGISLQGVSKKNIFIRHPDGAKYLIKNGNILFEFPIESQRSDNKPDELTKSLGALMEVCASSLYELYLGKDSEEEKLNVNYFVVLDSKKNSAYVGTKLLNDFIDAAHMTRTGINPFIESKNKLNVNFGKYNGKKIKGITFNLMIAFFLGEIDFNPGNYGLREKENYAQFYKLDHGHSFEFIAYGYNDLPTEATQYKFKVHNYPEIKGPPTNLGELRREFKRFTPEISVNLIDKEEFLSALKRIVAVSAEQLKETINECKIYDKLKLVDVDPAKENKKYDNIYNKLLERRSRVLEKYKENWRGIDDVGEFLEVSPIRH